MMVRTVPYGTERIRSSWMPNARGEGKRSQSGRGYKELIAKICSCKFETKPLLLKG